MHQDQWSPHEAGLEVYKVTLTAEDSFGERQHRTITVTDRREPGRIQEQASIEYGERHWASERYTATLMGSAITSWTPTDAGAFTIEVLRRAQGTW